MLKVGEHQGTAARLLKGQYKVIQSQSGFAPQLHLSTIWSALQVSERVSIRDEAPAWKVSTSRWWISASANSIFSRYVHEVVQTFVFMEIVVLNLLLVGRYTKTTRWCVLSAFLLHFFEFFTKGWHGCPTTRCFPAFSLWAAVLIGIAQTLRSVRSVRSDSRPSQASGCAERNQHFGIKKTQHRKKGRNFGGIFFLRSFSLSGFLCFGWSGREGC